MPKAVENLKAGDKVLIAEACTHVCQAEDIGRVKIPAWLNKKVGGELNYEWYTGDSFPEDVSSYKLVIHCGACMINRRAMLSQTKEMRRDRSFDRQLRSPDFLLTRNHGPRHVADERQLKGKSPGNFRALRI